MVLVVLDLDLAAAVVEQGLNLRGSRESGSAFAIPTYLYKIGRAHV